MKKQVFIGGALLLAAAISCTREQVITPLRTLTFQAVWADGPDTRTAIQSDGTSVWWSPKEEISIFDGEYSSSKFVSTNTTPQATVTFEGKLEGGQGGRSKTQYWALYPYSPHAYMEDGLIPLSVEYIQPGKEGTFADKTFPAVSVSDNSLMKFYHVCGGIRFSVANEGIGSVTFESIGGEPLTGYVSVGFGEDGPYVASVSEYDNQTSVTVVAPEGGFVPGAYYFAAILPGELSRGLNVTYSKLNGQFAEIALEKAITVRRARFGTIAGKDEGLTFRAHEITTPKAVDLGLSVKWASFNIGAAKPEEAGCYYAWGETEPKKVYDWGTYKWGVDEYELTKYNYEPISGVVDNKLQLDMEDDVAHVKLGDKWRIPTQDELEELVNTQYNPDYEWTLKSVGGIEGVEIACLANGNSIFLPQTGIRNGTTLMIPTQIRVGSSSLLPSNPRFLSALNVNIDESFGYYPYVSSGSRSSGFCIRPVYGDPPASIPVESILLEREKLSIFPGLSFHLKADIQPANATDPILLWSSSDESVATVNYAGSITSVAPGTATITASTLDGSKTASCQVTVHTSLKAIVTPAAVDLGLSVKWASFNLGAAKPEENGNYYAWGETEPKTAFDYDTYRWLDLDAWEFTKYVTDSSYGAFDNKQELDAEDDVAHVKLGGDWRMPTVYEVQELLDTRYDDGYRWQFKQIDGVPGFEVICRSNNNSIFLPFSGTVEYGELSNSISFWTRSLSDYTSDAARYGSVYSYDSFGPDGNYYHGLSYMDRYGGCPVRPVSGRSRK